MISLFRGLRYDCENGNGRFYTVYDQKLRGGSIGSACGKVLKAKNKGKFQVQLSEGTGLVMLDRVLHVFNIAYNQVSVAGLCND